VKLSDARTDAEVLEVLARRERHTAGDGAKCPDNRIPTSEDLEVWRRSEWPKDVMAECDRLLANVLRPTLTARTLSIWGMPLDGPRARFEWQLMNGAIVALSHVPFVPPDPANLRRADPNSPGTLLPELPPDADTRWLDDTGTEITTTLFMPLTKVSGRFESVPHPPDPEFAVHAEWCALPEPRPRHPLAPLVAAWQQFGPKVVTLDMHDRAIIPYSLRDAEWEQGALPLGLDHTTPLGPIREPKQGNLPFEELSPASSLVPPVAFLTLCDGAGSLLTQGLIVEVLTAVPRDDREWTAAPPVTLRNLFEWLWPRYYDTAADRMRGGYNRTRHLPLLRQALIEADNFRPVYGRYERRLIRIDDLPTAATRLDDMISFRVRHLPESDHGPMIERASTRRWRLVSAPAWRGTIRLAYLWDAAKARNNGARVYATRPVVARGPGGVILGANGKPLRDRRGAVVMDWSDRRAVILGANGKPAGVDNPPAYERNPAADRVPMLGPDDQIHLTYDANITRSNRRERLSESRKALRRKEAAGEVVIEVDGDGWRIIEARR